MLTVQALLPADSPRDANTVTAALLVAARHRVAIKAALSLLRDFFNQFRDKGDEDTARLMAEATESLLADQAILERTIAELQEIGGPGIEGWEVISRADIRRQTRTRAAQRDLIILSGKYLKLAVDDARFDRMEKAAAALGVTTGARDAG